MVGNGDVVIFLLAVVGTVCVLIIFYYILICISSSRINKTISTVQRVRARQQQQQQGQSSSGTSSSNQDQVRRILTRSLQSDRLPRADENAYILGPTATTAESQRDFRSGRPHRVGGRGGGGQRLSVPGHVRMANDNATLMRFYTAEELVNFPFDEHIDALRRQIDEEEERRSNRASMNSFLHPIDYSSRRVTVASPLSMGHGQRGDTDEDNIMMMSPNHSYGPEIVIDGQVRISTDRGHTRQGRARMCYSIPANYIGRPPAYLPTHEEDPPPNYSDAVRLTQIKQEESNEVT